MRWCWGGVTRALLTNPSCHQFPLHSPSHNRSPLEAQSPFPVSSHFYTKLFLCTSPSSNHPSEFFITEYSLVLISRRFSSVHPSFDNLNGRTLVNETNTGRGKHFFLPSSSSARWKSIQYSINRWDTELRALHCWESLFLIFLHYLAKVTLSSCLPWHYSKTNLEYAGWNPSHEYGTQDLHLPGHPSTTIYIKTRGHTFSCSLIHSTTDSHTLGGITPWKFPDLGTQGLGGGEEEIVKVSISRRIRKEKSFKSIIFAKVNFLEHWLLRCPKIKWFYNPKVGKIFHVLLPS